MRLKRNIIIAVIAVLICIAALITVFLMPDKMDTLQDENWSEAEDTSVIIVNYQKGSYVNSEIIVEAGENSYTLTKTTDENDKVQYVASSHPYLEVDEKGLNSLAENYSLVVMADTINENPADLAVYGLDNPQGKYTLVNENGKRTTVYIGAQIGSKYYSMVEGDKKVYIIYTAYGQAVLGGLNGLRETDLVNFQANNTADIMKSLKITAPFGTVMDIHLATEKDKVTVSNSKFVMSYPYTMPVYASKLIEFIQGVVPIKVEEFVEDNPSNLAMYGLSNPAYTLKIEDDKGMHTIYYGSRTPDGAGVYCKMEGKDFVFTMSATKLEAFEKLEPYTICDRFAQLISINNITSVNVASYDNSKNYTLTVDKNTAQLFFVNGKPAQESSFRTAYKYIVGIGLVSDAGNHAVKKKPQHKITFNFDDGTSYTVTYFDYDDRNYVLDRNGENSNFLVAKKSVEEMYKYLAEIKTN
ncbi:MAG: DUF4340 domain-containing protein [Clostridia bacterium]|nr:DUF4340 domain-containing protein [Clostridia bacterium]